MNINPLPSQIEKLEAENEDLKSKLIDLAFEMNYNKQTELLEFVKNLYESLEAKEIKRLPKKELLMNLKHSIEEFARIHRLNIR